MSTQTDNRSFEITFRKPSRVRIEHNGQTVYDQVLDGHTKLMLRDLNVPYVGVTKIFVNDTPMGQWEVS